MSIWRAIIYYLYTHIGQFHWEISPDLTQYQQIGNRYFIFENDVELSWTDAERACQKKGGHLATIKDEEEMYHIVYQIEDLTYYWLGINDHDNKGDFMSLASGKKFPFLCVLF
ncbi:accessory gland protein Acp29AB-like [Drosophila rhopaloa]|uniref:C-type lectin domain-containing protein n=1 Tax=Drosophila rhopaloa TaxID=1041015 RepID=A0ABM5J949_DRORH|nr:accessory gland protein Acp29AB-like [Drosophila rhopaloa]